MKNFLRQNWRVIFSCFVLATIGTGKADEMFKRQTLDLLSVIFPSVAYLLIATSLFLLVLQVFVWSKTKNLIMNIPLLTAVFTENIFLIILPFFPSAGTRETGYSVFLLVAIFTIFCLLLQLVVWFVVGVRRLLK